MKLILFLIIYTIAICGAFEKDALIVLIAFSAWIIYTSLEEIKKGFGGMWG
jgi:hypothetical protein